MDNLKETEQLVFTSDHLYQYLSSLAARNSFDEFDDFENDIEYTSDPRFGDVIENIRMTTKNDGTADDEQQQQSEGDDENEAKNSNLVQDDDDEGENSAEDENEDSNDDENDSNDRDEDDDDDDIDDDPVEPVPTGKYASCERGKRGEVDSIASPSLDL